MPSPVPPPSSGPSPSPILPESERLPTTAKTLSPLKETLVQALLDLDSGNIAAGYDTIMGKTHQYREAVNSLYKSQNLTLSEKKEIKNKLDSIEWHLGNVKQYAESHKKAKTDAESAHVLEEFDKHRESCLTLAVGLPGGDLSGLRQQVFDKIDSSLGHPEISILEAPAHITTFTDLMQCAEFQKPPQELPKEATDFIDTFKRTVKSLHALGVDSGPLRELNRAADLVLARAEELIEFRKSNPSNPELWWRNSPADMAMSDALGNLRSRKKEVTGTY